MENRLLELLGSGLSLILPEICPSCRRRVCDHPSPVCFPCRREIFSSPSCPPVSSDHISVIWSCRPYAGALRQCIRQFKYRERRRLSLLFADLVRSYLTENLTGRETIDMVIPVPLHCSKLRKRGYNQAGLLASVLSDGLSAPAAQKVLLKTKDTRSQMGLTRKIRLDNLTGSFAVVDRTQISGKTVLLVDDVMTTGATLEACAKELLRGGAAEVKAFTLARVI